MVWGRALSSLNLVSPSEEQEAWAGGTLTSVGLDLLSRGRVLLSGASSFGKLWDLGEDSQTIPNSPWLSKEEAPQKIHPEHLYWSHPCQSEWAPWADSGWKWEVGGCAKERPRAEGGLRLLPGPLPAPPLPRTGDCHWRN